MRITGSVDGADRSVAALTLMVARVREATPDAVDTVLDRVATQQRTLLGLGSHPYGTSTGSPPGSPPWRISGDLQGSVHVQRARPDGPDSWSGQTGASTVYARIQELGGWAGRGHRSWLAPRPSLYPAWRIVEPTARSVFIARWTVATRP